jgi:hypothetical protein
VAVKAFIHASAHGQWAGRCTVMCPRFYLARYFGCSTGGDSGERPAAGLDL